MDTTNNEWVLTVAYKDGFESSWRDATIAGVVIAAFSLSVMVLKIMIAQTQYRELLFKMLPASCYFFIFIFTQTQEKFLRNPFMVISYSKCTMILTFESFYPGQCYRKTKKGADCD